MIQCPCLKKLSSIALPLLFVAAMLVPVPAGADSRSAAFRISCTVAPMIEMAQTNTIAARSNLGTQYLSTESLVYRDGQQIKLVSVTAP